MREGVLGAWSKKEKNIWVALTAGLALFVYFYWFSISSLFKIWNNYGTYSHGYLTILLSVYLIYVAVKEKEFRASGTSKFSVILLFATSLVWLLAYLASINTLQMLCLPFFIFFSFTYFCGWMHFKTILIPIFILLFTVPVWAVLLPNLQSFAVVATKVALDMTSLDFRLIDNSVIFSRGIFEIEESCSGLRYVLVGMLLSVVFGFLNYDNYRSTILLLLVSIVIMLVGNVVRILIVIGLGVYKGMEHPQVQDHENLGWLVFALFLVPLFIFARMLNEREWNAHGIAPVHLDEATKKLVYSPILSFVLYVVVIAMAPLYANYIDNREVTIKTLDADILQAYSGWLGPTSNASSWSPDYSAYSERFMAQFTKQSSTVALNILHYSKLNQAGELVSIENRLVDKQKWYIKDSLSGHVVNPENKNEILEVNIATIISKKTRECLRVWYWFEVNGKSHIKKWRVKIDDVIQKLQGKSGSSINTLSIECIGQTNAADRILNDFLASHYLGIKSAVAF